MGRAVKRLFLFNIPFILISGVFIYLGFTASETALTDDGYSLKWFFFLMGGCFLLTSLATSGGILIWMLVKKRRMDDLVATGKQGTAVVLGLSDTGVTINDAPRVKLSLEIHLPGLPPYKATKTVAIPVIYIPQIQTGATINVLADPADPFNEKRIAILLK